MKKQIFNKNVINRINHLQEVDKLPGIFVKHQLDLTTKIFIEQYSVFVDVLRWKFKTDELALHFAASVWKELKESLYNLYLSDNNQFELLVANQTNYINYLYEKLEDLFYKNARLINPFMKSFKTSLQITAKENSQLESRLEELIKYINNNKHPAQIYDKKDFEEMTRLVESGLHQKIAAETVLNNRGKFNLPKIFNIRLDAFIKRWRESESYDNYKRTSKLKREI